MEISDVRIKLVNKPDSKLLGFASFTIDKSFAVHDVRIIAGNNGNFITMPTRTTPDGEHKDIVHPLNNETRGAISSAILAEYEKAKQEA